MKLPPAPSVSKTLGYSLLCVSIAMFVLSWFCLIPGTINRTGEVILGYMIAGISLVLFGVVLSNEVSIYAKGLVVVLAALTIYLWMFDAAIPNEPVRFARETSRTGMRNLASEVWMRYKDPKRLRFDHLTGLPEVLSKDEIKWLTNEIYFGEPADYTPAYGIPVPVVAGEPCSILYQPFNIAIDFDGDGFCTLPSGKKVKGGVVVFTSEDYYETELSQLPYH